MRKHYLATTVSSALEFIQDLCFGRVRDTGSIKVGSFAVCIPLFLLESSLKIEPLVGEKFATIHTSYGNDHPNTRYRIYFVEGRQVCKPGKGAVKHLEEFPRTG